MWIDKFERVSIASVSLSLYICVISISIQCSHTVQWVHLIIQSGKTAIHCALAWNINHSHCRFSCVSCNVFTTADCFPIEINCNIQWNFFILHSVPIYRSDIIVRRPDRRRFCLKSYIFHVLILFPLIKHFIRCKWLVCNLWRKKKKNSVWNRKKSVNETILWSLDLEWRKRFKTCFGLKVAN